MWRVFCLMCMTVCFILVRPFITIIREIQNEYNGLYNRAFNYVLSDPEEGIPLNVEHERFLQLANTLGDNVVIEGWINSGSLVDIMWMDNTHDYAGMSIISILDNPKRTYMFEELSFMWLSLVLRLKSAKIHMDVSDTQCDEFKARFASLLLKIRVTPWSLYLKCGDSKIQVYSIFKPSTILNLIMWVKLVGLITDIGIDSKLANKLVEISEPYISLPKILTPRNIVDSVEQLLDLYILAYTGYILNPSFYFANMWEEIGSQLVPYSNLVTILMARVEKFDVPNKLKVLPHGALDKVLIDLKNRLNDHLDIEINETDDLFQDLQKPCIDFINHVYNKASAKNVTKEVITTDEQLTLLLSTFITLDERLRLNHVQSTVTS